MASVGNVSSISIEELKTVLQSLKQQREALNNTYKNMIINILDSSSSCLSVSGLDYSEICEFYKTTFTNIDNNFASLIDLLENNVIKNYSELSFVIKKMFNVEFASKMSSLLGIK